MLTITIPGDELWDEEAERFVYTEELVLEFEHSLVSLSKWEAKFHKPFLTGEERTEDELVGYIEAMLLTRDVPENYLTRLTSEHIQIVDDYINDPMTGSSVTAPPENSRTGERISAELIYFWMSQFQIDKAHETWHLNRLFMLIRIHHAKTQKPKKKSAQEIAQENRERNLQRREQLGSKG